MPKFRIALSAAALATALVAGFAAGQASSEQPHMQTALGYLKSARSELVAATANKGGHRVKALAAVNDAISETQAGINFAG